MSARRSARELQNAVRSVLGIVRLELSQDEYLGALDALDELTVRAAVSDVMAGQSPLVERRAVRCVACRHLADAHNELGCHVLDEFDVLCPCTEPRVPG